MSSTFHWYLTSIYCLNWTRYSRYTGFTIMVLIHYNTKCKAVNSKMCVHVTLRTCVCSRFWWCWLATRLVSAERQWWWQLLITSFTCCTNNQTMRFYKINIHVLSTYVSALFERISRPVNPTAIIQGWIKNQPTVFFFFTIESSINTKLGVDHVKSIQRTPQNSGFSPQENCCQKKKMRWDCHVLEGYRCRSKSRAVH